MPIFAIQYGLVVSALISSITAFSGVFKTTDTMERFFGPSFPSGGLFLWNMKMQFLSLLVCYGLNIIVAVWAPFTTLAYLLAVGNMVRVAFVLSYALDAEKIALMGMAENGKMLKVICVLQTVLAVVIAGCTYVSSTNADYVAYTSGLAATAASADFGPYTYFVYVFAGIGILGRAPQVIKPIAGMARFMAGGEDALPSDKGELTILTFAFTFTAVNFLLVWSLTLVIFAFVPTITPIATFMTAVSLIFLPMMFSTILNAADTGFGIPQLLFFLCLISIMLGSSLLTLLL